MCYAEELDFWTKMGKEADSAAEARLQAEEKEAEEKLDQCIDRENAFWSEKS